MMHAHLFGTGDGDDSLDVSHESEGDSWDDVPHASKENRAQLSSADFDSFRQVTNSSDSQPFYNVVGQPSSASASCHDVVDPSDYKFAYEEVLTRKPPGRKRSLAIGLMLEDDHTTLKSPAPPLPLEKNLAAQLGLQQLKRGNAAPVVVPSAKSVVSPSARPLSPQHETLSRVSSGAGWPNQKMVDRIASFGSLGSLGSLAYDDGFEAPNPPPGDGAAGGLTTQDFQALGFTKRDIEEHRQHVAKSKAVLIKKEEMIAKQREFVEKKVKKEECDQRRAFLDAEHRQEKSRLWTSVLHFANSLSAFRRLFLGMKKKEITRRLFLPTVLVCVRRVIRRARCRIAMRRIQRPTLTQLRSDKMLNLFSDPHLTHLLDRTYLKYYFQNETMIFMGCEEDECFLLYEGTADVMMGSTKVYTLMPGMVFGSVGMISGEPRTATIVARCPSFAWAFRRADFESYGARDLQVTTARNIINELRQKNLRSVYAPLLVPDYFISKFGAFERVSQEVLQDIIQTGTPRVLKAGDVISALTVHPAELRSTFLMRGSIVVTIAKGQLITKARSAEELICTFLEGPGLQKRKEGEPLTHLKQMTANLKQYMDTLLAGEKSATTHEDFVVGECEGPILINFAPLVLAEPTPFFCESGLRGSDIIVFGRERIMSQDILELAQMRQNALNRHCLFMPVLSNSNFTRAIFRLNAIMFHFTSNVKYNEVKQTPWVFAAGDIIRFDKKSKLEALVVTSGQLEDFTTPVSGTNYVMWPEIHITYFGCVDCMTRAKTRVEAIKVSRGHVIGALIQSLEQPELQTLVAALTTLFVSKTAKKPYFDETDLAPTDAKSDQISKAKFRTAKALTTQLANTAKGQKISRKESAKNLFAPLKEKGSDQTKSGGSDAFGDLVVDRNVDSDSSSDDESSPSSGNSPTNRRRKSSSDSSRGSDYYEQQEDYGEQPLGVTGGQERQGRGGAWSQPKKAIGRPVFEKRDKDISQPHQRKAPTFTGNARVVSTKSDDHRESSSSGHADSSVSIQSLRAKNFASRSKGSEASTSNGGSSTSIGDGERFVPVAHKAPPPNPLFVQRAMERRTKSDMPKAMQSDVLQSPPAPTHHIVVTSNAFSLSPDAQSDCRTPLKRPPTASPQPKPPTQVHPSVSPRQAARPVSTLQGASSPSSKRPVSANPAKGALAGRTVAMNYNDKSLFQQAFGD